MKILLGLTNFGKAMTDDGWRSPSYNPATVPERITVTWGTPVKVVNNLELPILVLYHFYVTTNLDVFVVVGFGVGV